MASIRPYRHGDLAAVATIEAACFPEFKTTPEELAHRIAHQPPAGVCARWVAETKGEVVGTAELVQDQWMFDVGTLDAIVQVAHPHRRQGIGADLWDEAAAFMAEHGAAKSRTWLAETWAPGLAFAEARGFGAKMSERESRLDLRTYDPVPWRPAIDRVVGQGVRITTLAETGAGPEVMHEIYEADVEFTKDMPSPDAITRPDEAVWTRRILESPRHLPQLHFTAWENGSVVGCSTLVKPPATPYLLVGTTGVVRSQRRRGVGTALKALVQERAKEQGFPGIYTWNETGNSGMLAINLAMGFVPEKDWLSLSLDFTT